MQKIAEVALNIPLKKTFHYLIPEKFSTNALIGAKVEVEFGHKKLFGFIVGITRSFTNSQWYYQQLSLSNSRVSNITQTQ